MTPTPDLAEKAIRQTMKEWVAQLGTPPTTEEPATAQGRLAEAWTRRLSESAEDAVLLVLPKPKTEV